jgi:ABC-type bacteriocin/lantibiotic exporters, contain an N-terminal double-glycine peptidase domain
MAKKVKEKGYTIQALKRANSIAFKANKKVYILYILISLFMTLNTFISLRSTEYTVTSAYNLFTKDSEFMPVLIGISAFAASTLIFSLIGMGNNMLRNRLMLDITYYFENNLNDKLSSIKWDYYESNETYLKIHEVRSNSLNKIHGFVDSTIQYLTGIPTAIILGYYLFQINFIAVIVYLVFIVVCNGTASKRFGTISKLWEEIQPYSQKQNYFFGICGDKVTHQEYKFNRLYKYTSDKWEEAYNKEYKIRLKIFGNHEFVLQTARIIMNIPYIAMLVFVCYEIAMGNLEMGFLIMANNLLNHIINAITGTYYTISANRVDSRFIKAYDEICELENAPPVSDKVVHSDIKLENIIYQYPQSEHKALNNLCFDIKQGEKIAVVGVNGSGKTTCTNLLLSLTNNFTGNMTDGKASAAIDLSNSVSCILQDFAQYQMTVKENIEAGFAGKQFTDDEILEILNKVGLKETIIAFEKGIHTPLGQLDDGIELSKGQWQKLAIARLLANPNTTIWILDEPTAYLDPIAEIEIYDMIYKLAEDRTVLFISHRLGFAKKADKIVLFDKGHIEESGTHDALVNQHGVYAEMYSNQEEWYLSKV